MSVLAGQTVSGSNKKRKKRARTRSNEETKCRIESGTASRGSTLACDVSACLGFLLSDVLSPGSMESDKSDSLGEVRTVRFPGVL